jgi:hypothetical protein
MEIMDNSIGIIAWQVFNILVVLGLIFILLLLIRIVRRKMRG